MAKKDWLPPCFKDLNAALLANVEASRGLSYSLRETDSGSYYVYGLLRAASKFKLANSIVGIEYNDYVVATQRQYTAQIRLMAAFVAFESFARLRGGAWFDLAGVSAGRYATEAQNIQSCITESSLLELKAFMAADALKERIDRYLDGDLSEVFAVACAMRNGFAHGLYGSRGQFYKSALKLRPLILKCIEDQISADVAIVQRAH